MFNRSVAHCEVPCNQEYQGSSLFVTTLRIFKKDFHFYQFFEFMLVQIYAVQRHPILLCFNQLSDASFQLPRSGHQISHDLVVRNVVQLLFSQGCSHFHKQVFLRVFQPLEHPFFVITWVFTLFCLFVTLKIVSVLKVLLFVERLAMECKQKLKVVIIVRFNLLPQFIGSFESTLIVLKVLNWYLLCLLRF